MIEIELDSPLPSKGEDHTQSPEESLIEVEHEKLVEILQELTTMQLNIMAFGTESDKLQLALCLESEQITCGKVEDTKPQSPDDK